MKYISFLSLLIAFALSGNAQTNNKPGSSPSSFNQIPPALFSGLHWRNVGPARAGRCDDVCGVIQNNKVYYAGAAGGGLWKTEDGGYNWNCISDSVFTSASVGAIAVAPSNENVVYVGMGEVEMRGNISFGDGIYKSTDAGATWKHVGLNDSYAIGTIAVHPQNENIVYVAAQGHVWGPNKERGLYRSTDGGATWKLILKGKDDTTGCVDVKIDPMNPSIIYASMWKAFRTPYSLSSGGTGSGLYKSTDGGDTWKLISENPGMPKGLMGKIIVAISTTDHMKLWASVENESTAGIYFSPDGGETWSLLNNENDLTQRPWYFSNLFVDPKNDNEIYILNVEYWKSIDGGVSFSRAYTNTWDNHDMWINPNNPDNYIVGGDGGPTITFDDGANWSETDIPTAQFYHVNLDNDFPYHLYGAQQDNSSLKIVSRSSHYSIGTSDWRSVAGGEAGYIVPDPTNSHITYGGEYDGIFSSFNEDNDIYRIISVEPEQHYGAGAITAQKRFNWTFPITFSPHNPKCLYATSNYVHRSFDGGVSWETISPDLTRNDPKTLQASGGNVTLDNTGVEFYATVFAFAESPVTAGVLWAGSDDGMVHSSKDNGKTWLDVTPTSLPEWSMISYVEPSWFDAGTCYISATRYKLDDTHPYLFRTTDYGKTWTKIVSGLPENMYTRCIRNDPNVNGLLYAGLETGIYFSVDNGVHWQSLQLNLPVCPVVDIRIHKGEKDVVIATHGRSFWILDDISPIYELYDDFVSSGKISLNSHLFKISPAYRMPGPGWDGDDESSGGGENEAVGVAVRYYLKSSPAKELKLIFYESDGDSIITYSNLYDKKRSPVTPDEKFFPAKKHVDAGRLNAQPGMHQFVWNMRYPDAKGDTSATFEASLAGPLAVPGRYLVKMFVGDSLVGEQEFEIVKDPRNPSTQSELQAQFDLNKNICTTLDEIAGATSKIRKMRSSIETYMSEEKDSVKLRQFKTAAEPVLDSLTSIEEALYNPKIKAYEDNLKYPIMLEEKLAGLNYFLQMADTGPTQTMLAKYEDLLKRINVQLQKLNAIEKTQIAELNRIAGLQSRQMYESE